MSNFQEIWPNQLRDTLYRHGDVLIQRVSQLPQFCQPREGATLASGEVTGHSHRLEPANAIQLWEKNKTLYLEVRESSATLVHEEHHPIELAKGIYHVWKQREYRPDTYVEVED